MKFRSNNKKRLLELLSQTIILLKECQKEDVARWFEKQQNTLANASLQSQDFQHSLREIRQNLAGMGSFSDIALQPKSGSRLSERDAASRQWELVEQLGDTISSLERR